MWKARIYWFLLAISAMGLLACSDPVVLANVDNFTCAYLPWWAGDCTSASVHKKALDVLQNGLIAAEISCYLPNRGSIDRLGQYCRYRDAVGIQARKLVDGSCIVGSTHLAGSSEGLGGLAHIFAGVSPSNWVGRHYPQSAVCGMPGPNDPDSYSFVGGNIRYTTTESCTDSPGPYSEDTPITSENCIGYNFSEFGVTE